MEFIFQPSAYDDPALEAEAAELMRQRLEARSREVLPGMWRVTDRLNGRAAGAPDRERRRKRWRIYGVLLTALGIFALVPGLMEPRTPSLIRAGGWAVFAGLVSFCLARKRKPLRPPASCRRGAEDLLKLPRETDWAALQAEVRFDETGWTVTTAQGESRTSCKELGGVFETEHLWMLVTEGGMALLLQKKDLIKGTAADFPPYLRETINKNH